MKIINDEIGYVISKDSGMLQRISNSFDPEFELIVYRPLPEGFYGGSIRFNIEKTIWEGELVSGFELNSVGEPIKNQIHIRALENRKITEKANNIIENKYPVIKQRKLMAIAIKLQRKLLIQGVALTPEEEALLLECEQVDNWITAIRNIENEAILNELDVNYINWTI